MTVPLSLSVPESLTFEQAISLTQSLLDQIEGGALSEEEIESVLTQLVSSENGARGFFVTYLTDSRPLAERPSIGVINALRTSPEIVSELLVKNVAMSAAMVVAHRRRQDEEMAANSARTSTRSAGLIATLELPRTHELAQQMLESVTAGEGVYEAFLKRWGYDAEQRQAIQQAVQPMLSESGENKSLA